MPDTTSSPPTRPGPGDLASFWELALDLLALVGPDGTFLHVNPAFTRVLGWTRDEMVGRTAFDFVHPDDIDATRLGFEGIAAPGRKVQDFENRYRTSSGDHRTLRWNARTSMDGRVVHAVARDVTEEHRRVEQLQLSEERFRRSMRDAAIGMAIVDLDGRFVDVNDALCEIVGRPPDVLTTLTFQDITHPDDLDADVELAGQLVDGTIGHYDLEKRYLHADGSVVWVLLTGSVIRNPDGTPRHFIAQVQDVTDRRAAEDELARTLVDLRQSNETLAEFAAVAAHDLKAPLAVASGVVDVLGFRYAGALPPEARDLLARGTAHLHRLAHQVDGLLRIASVAGRALDLEDIALDDAVDAVVALLGDTLSDATLTVDAPHAVAADAAGLGLLLQNVVLNAVGHGGSRVELRSRLEDDRVLLEVDDDGPGIPVADREQVFDLFGRSSTGQRSTGLGLALCRRIVERHGGEIGIGDAPLGGARVWFTLPRARGRAVTDRRVDAKV